MTLFFFIVFGFYFLLVLLLISGWQLALEKKREPSSTIHKKHKISVIIPFRDEASNLSRLLEGLNAQRYSMQDFEVIFVNDHSSDLSYSLVELYCKQHTNFRLLALSDQLNGKKAALTYGIEAANGEIIVTTDADCFHPSHWLECINSIFHYEHVVMGIGAVKIESESSFFSQLQTMEFTSLVASGVATLSFGVPTMCNGANLSFRKSAFISVDGYAGNLNIPSGDDEFLMRKMDEKFPGGISFVSESDNVVSTQAHKSISAFVQQRVRWAGKLRINQSLGSKLLGSYIYLFQLSYLFLLICFILGLIPYRIGASLLIGKMLVEFLFLYQISLFLKIQWRWAAFFSLQLIYPVYVFWIGLLAQGKVYRWKGRLSRHQQDF